MDVNKISKHEEDCNQTIEGMALDEFCNIMDVDKISKHEEDCNQTIENMAIDKFCNIMDIVPISDFTCHSLNIYDILDIARKRKLDEISE